MCRTCVFLHVGADPSCAAVVRSRPVLGQAHTPRRRLIPLAALALAVLASPAVGGENPSHRAASLRAQDVAIAAKSRAAVLGLYALDERLGSARTKLSALQQQATSLRAQRASLAHQINVAKRGTQISQRRLAERLRVLYEEGDVEPLEVVLGATSLDEALTNLDNLNRVTGQGEDVLRELANARGSLRSATRTLAAREAALRAATREARVTADALANARAARGAYISSLAERRRLTQRQIAALLVPQCVGAVRDARCAHDHPDRNRLLAPGEHLERIAGRLGRGRRRPVVDPTRNAHDGSGVRRGGRGGHRWRRRGLDDRPLVPVEGAGERVGPPHGHRRHSLTPVHWAS
jgi:peptidoglycan hydrolase CwlO-like protein